MILVAVILSSSTSWSCASLADCTAEVLHVRELLAIWMDTIRHTVGLSPQYLIPSWQELNMTIFTAVLLVALYCLLQSIGEQQENRSDIRVRAGTSVNRGRNGTLAAGFGKRNKSGMKLTGTEQATSGRQQVARAAEGPEIYCTNATYLAKMFSLSKYPLAVLRISWEPGINLLSPCRYELWWRDMTCLHNLFGDQTGIYRDKHK